MISEAPLETHLLLDKASFGAWRRHRDTVAPETRRYLTMGMIYAEVTLSNPRHRNDALAPMVVRALVDTGAVNLCIPAHIALQLELEELERREVTTADGKVTLVPYVGPVQVRFENRSCFVGAFVLGDSVLLGSIPLEDMDLVLNPRLEQVTVNPQSPNIPSALVMRTIMGSGACRRRRSAPRG